MTLSGNLSTMDLPEILQWISAARKTGTLHLERRSVQKRLAFEEGVIRSSWSNDPREYLGQFLIREGRVTEEQLFRALLRQEKEGRALGEILMGDGLLSERDLRHALQTKAEETIYDLFLWPEGKFVFKDAEIPAPSFLQVDVGVTSVLLEGIRRVDEWKRIREIFPSMGTTFKVHVWDADGEEPAALAALEQAASGKNLAAIAMELRRSEFEAAWLLHELYKRGLLVVDQVEETAGTDIVARIGDLLALGALRMREKRFDAAGQAYEEVLSLDPLNQNAKKELIAVAGARNREHLLGTVPLDQVPVLRMDFAALRQENFDPQEGFVLSRVNGQWDVRSILKLCPMAEEDARLIFVRLLERNVIELR